MRHLLIKIIELVTGIFAVLLVIRFLLRLFGAVSTRSSFVEWIYSLTRPMVEPFFGIVPNFNFGARMVLELNTLIAILVYLIISYILVEVVNFATGGRDRYYW